MDRSTSKAKVLRSYDGMGRISLSGFLHSKLSLILTNLYNVSHKHGLGSIRASREQKSAYTT